MRLASGWRGTIWHVFSPYLHGTFPQNSSILTVDNPVKKNISALLLTHWSVISVKPRLHTGKEYKFPLWQQQQLLIWNPISTENDPNTPSPE